MVDEASGTRAWLFDSVSTVVDQTVGQMTVDVARFLTGPMDAQVQRWVREGRDVRFVHDWSSCRTYDNEARDLIIAWGRRSRAWSRQVLVHVSEEANPFLRIAAATGVSVLRAVGMKVELAKSLAPVLAELSALPVSAARTP